MPPAAVQRNASMPAADVASPTMTEPSLVIPNGSLEKSPPARSPNPTMPAPGVHTNTSGPAAEVPVPTTMLPSDEASAAALLKNPPGRSPSGSAGPPPQRAASKPASELPQPTNQPASLET